MKAILKVNKKSPYFDKNGLTFRLKNLCNDGGSLVFFTEVSGEFKVSIFITQDKKKERASGLFDFNFSLK